MKKKYLVELRDLRFKNKIIDKMIVEYKDLVKNKFCMWKIPPESFLYETRKIIN